MPVRVTLRPRKLALHPPCAYLHPDLACPSVPPGSPQSGLPHPAWAVSTQPAAVTAARGQAQAPLISRHLLVKYRFVQANKTASSTIHPNPGLDRSYSNCALIARRPRGPAHIPPSPTRTVQGQFLSQYHYVLPRPPRIRTSYRPGPWPSRISSTLVRSDPGSPSPSSGSGSGSRSQAQHVQLLSFLLPAPPSSRPRPRLLSLRSQAQISLSSTLRDLPSPPSLLVPTSAAKRRVLGDLPVESHTGIHPMASAAALAA